MTDPGDLAILERRMRDAKRRDAIAAFILHPLPIPLTLIGSVAGLSLMRHAWVEVHLPVITVGVAILLSMWLARRADWGRLGMIEDSFDEVRRDHRGRLQSLEGWRDSQITHNSKTREEIRALAERVDTIEQLPIIHAARNR
jgi:hypothetical protein